MRFVIFLLLIPVFAQCQTVHLEKGRIAYNASVKIEGITKKEIYERAKQAMLKNIKGVDEEKELENNEKDEIIMAGEMRLSSSHDKIKTLQYIMKISVKDDGYKYEIDSVYIKETQRGEKTIKISSEELVNGMESSGNVAIDTEKQLNEIDMRIQKLLHLIERDIKRAPIVNRQ
jgi:Domain of unknown function (DUF4468) with TBP-like fold